MVRTNVEALLQHHQTKPPARRPEHQTPDEARPSAKKLRSGPGAGRASKKGARTRPAKASKGDESGDGDPGDPSDSAVPSDADLAINTSSIASTTSITSAHELAFTRVRAEIEALPRDEVRRLTVHVPAASMLALGALPKMLAFREAMRAAFTSPPVEALDKLEDYALAAARAHARVLPHDEGETNLRVLLKEAGPLRERLLLNAESLASFGLLNAKKVAAIRRGTGHLDTAQALSALGLLYVDAWPALASKTPLERGDVERAIELGGLLLKALGQRRQGTDGSGDPIEAEEQLGKAFELFRRAYESCRAAIVYLRRDEGDADLIAPPLAHSRRRGRGTPAEEPVADEPDSPDGPDAEAPGGETDEAPAL
jgi:hypothetical protein